MSNDDDLLKDNSSIGLARKMVRIFKFANAYKAREKANLEQYYKKYPRNVDPPGIKKGMPWWQRIFLALIALALLSICALGAVYVVIFYLLLRYL